MTAPLSIPVPTAYQPTLPPAYLSNGIVGLRVGSLALLHGYASVNGYVGVHAEANMESNAQAPYPLAGDLRLGGSGGLWLSQVPERATFRDQAYDFSCGELCSRFTFTVGEMTASVKVLTFCSRSLPTLVLQEVQVEVNQACRLDLRAAIDPSGVPGQARLRDVRTFTGHRPSMDGSLLSAIIIISGLK